MRADNEHEQRYADACAALKAIQGVGSGPMGLTPEHVKATPAYQSARVEKDRAFAALRTFNAAKSR